MKRLATYRAFRPVLAVAVLVTVCAGAVHRAEAQGPRSRNPVEIVQEAASALEQKRYEDALEGFGRAAAQLPRDASIKVGAGIAAFMLDRLEEAQTWLSGALELRPNDTTASSYLGEALFRQGQVSEAIAVYEAALEHTEPEHRVSLEASLVAWRADSQIQSRFYQTQGAHFSVLFDGPADEATARRVVEMLEAAYWRVGAALNTYPARQITVVLYTQAQFRDVTRAPEWAVGVYDGRIRLPIRNALDRPQDLERILTHEFVHAVVASIGGAGVPAWLNEGLATYFEPGGVESAERQLASSPTRIPWDRLDRQFADMSSEDAGAAYSQSTAAVKMMVDLRGAPAVVALLRAIARGTAFDAAFQQAIAMRFDDFAAMILRR